MNKQNEKVARLEKPEVLSSLIEYQNDSIVSKTLIDKRVGTVTLFAFDEGQNLSEHTAPYDAMVYIFDGKAKITIAQKNYTVKDKEMLILPANIPHSVKADSRFKMLLIMIRD